MTNVEVPPNPLGRVSFWLGIAVVAAEVLRQLGQAFVLGTGNFDSLELYYLVTGLVILAIGVAAVVTGFVALVRPGLPRVFAAVGLALGGASVVSGIAGWLVNLILFAFGN